MAGERTPYDCEPYYCLACGLGYGEYIACESMACELESPSRAERRKTARKSIRATLTKGGSE